MQTSKIGVLLHEEGGTEDSKIGILLHEENNHWLPLSDRVNMKASKALLGKEGMGIMYHIEQSS